MPYAFAVTQTDMCMNDDACLLSRTQHTHTHTQLRIAPEDGMAGARHARAKISLLGLAQAARPWTGSWRRGATATCTKCLRSRRNANSVSAASAVGARRASGQVFKHDSRSEHRQDRRVPNDTVEATLTPAVASLHNSALCGARPFVVAQTGATQLGVAHVWIACPWRL